VRVYPDRPFVLAGLKRNETVKTKNGVPFFSKIPVVGWAFGGETNSKRNVELVVVITPTFDVSTDSKIEKVESKIRMTADEQLAKDVAMNLTAITLPRNWFGFDQWALGNADK
jgi:type II secretory pathway component GspD/PulD (secretin)